MEDSSLPARVCLCLALVTGESMASGDAGTLCEAQAGQILERLEAEVVGKLDSVARAAASAIVVDVCHAREAAVDAQLEEAVQQARENTSGLFSNSGNKAGNKRLKRKQH